MLTHSCNPSTSEVDAKVQKFKVNLSFWLKNSKPKQSKPHFYKKLMLCGADWELRSQT